MVLPHLGLLINSFEIWHSSGSTGQTFRCCPKQQHVWWTISAASNRIWQHGKQWRLGQTSSAAPSTSITPVPLVPRANKLNNQLGGSGGFMASEYIIWRGRSFWAAPTPSPSPLVPPGWGEQWLQHGKN